MFHGQRCRRNAVGVRCGADGRAELFHMPDPELRFDSSFLPHVQSLQRQVPRLRESIDLCLRQLVIKEGCALEDARHTHAAWEEWERK